MRRPHALVEILSRSEDEYWFRSTILRSSAKWLYMLSTIVVSLSDPCFSTAPASCQPFGKLWSRSMQMLKFSFMEQDWLVWELHMHKAPARGESMIFSFWNNVIKLVKEFAGTTVQLGPQWVQFLLIHLNLRWPRRTLFPRLSGDIDSEGPRLWLELSPIRDIDSEPRLRALGDSQSPRHRQRGLEPSFMNSRRYNRHP